MTRWLSEEQPTPGLGETGPRHAWAVTDAVQSERPRARREA